MTTDLTPLVNHLRRLASPPAPDSDAALLRRFVRSRDEAAFAELVARHGPMVLRVCRRVLGDEHAAEDAFQAAFLILARRAGGVRRPEALAGWLYGVALRVARKARGAAFRRARQAPGDGGDPPAPTPDPLDALTTRELLDGLDEEVQRLPEVYRLPMVLCCLEGLTQEEVARRLGWTPGSVKGRLERGRATLHARLARRGLNLSAALAAAEAVRGTAVVPLALAGASAGVLALVGSAALGAVGAKAKFLAPLALALLLAGAGAGLLTAWGAGQAPHRAQPAPPQGRVDAAADEPKEDPIQAEMKRLEGTWIPVAYQSGKEKVEGEEFKKSDLSQLVLTIQDGKYQEKNKEGTGPAFTIKIDPTQSPKTLDRTSTEGQTKGQVARSIYDLDGDRLRICSAFEFAEVRPKDFTADGTYVLVFQRADAKRPDPPALEKPAPGPADPAMSPPVKFHASAVPLQGGVGGPVIFSFDGKHLVGGDANTLCIWRTATGKLAHTMNPPGGASRLVYYPNSRLLRISDNIIGPRFSPDTSWLAGVPTDAAPIVLRDAETGEVVHTLEGVEGAKGDGDVIIWDGAAEKVLRPLEGSAGGPTAYVFSPDNWSVAGVTHEGQVKLWDVKTGRATRTLGGTQVHCVAFSPDGRKVAAGGRDTGSDAPDADGVVWVWDAATGKELLTIRKAHHVGVVTIAYSSDGKRLITAGSMPHRRSPTELIPIPYDGQVKEWDAETGKELLAFPTNTGNLDWAVVSPDGKHVLVNPGWDKGAVVWALEGGD